MTAGLLQWITRALHWGSMRSLSFCSALGWHTFQAAFRTSAVPHPSRIFITGSWTCRPPSLLLPYRSFPSWLMQTCVILLKLCPSPLCTLKIMLYSRASSASVLAGLPACSPDITSACYSCALAFLACWKDIYASVWMEACKCMIPHLSLE